MGSKNKDWVKSETKIFSFSNGGPFDACWFWKSQFPDVDQLWQIEMVGQTHPNVEIVVPTDVQT